MDKQLIRSLNEGYILCDGMSEEPFTSEMYESWPYLHAWLVMSIALVEAHERREGAGVNFAAGQGTMEDVNKADGEIRLALKGLARTLRAARKTKHG